MAGRARADLPRVPAVGDRLQRLQRGAGRGAGTRRARGPPALPGPRPAGAGMGRRGGRLGLRRAGGRDPPRAGAGDRLSPGHRRPAAALRRRSLRGRRGAAVRGAVAAGGRPLRRRQRGRGPRGRRARAARRGARQPPRDGAGHPGPRPRRRAVRGEDPRQRARVHGQAAPALQALRAGGPGARGRDPRGLVPHRREPVDRDGRPHGRGTHPAGAARGRRGAVHPARAGRGAGGARRACARTWTRSSTTPRTSRPSRARPARRRPPWPPSSPRTGSWSSSAS